MEKEQVGGDYTFNLESVQKQLGSNSMSTLEKISLIKNLVITGFHGSKTLKGKIYFVASFLELTTTHQSLGWQLSDSETETKTDKHKRAHYDEIFRMFALQSIGMKNAEVYFGKLFEVVEVHSDLETSSAFMRKMMGTVLEEAPYLVYAMFRSKSWQIKSRHLNRSAVLNSCDLTYVLKACAKFDENKIYQLYTENQDLHNDESQQEVFLSLCVRHKDWTALQQRFESMFDEGNSPNTIHYGITMQALEYLEADGELERLYEQMLNSGIEIGATIFDARIKSSLRRKDYESMPRLFNEYIKLTKEGKADPDGVASLFPLSMRGHMDNQDFKAILLAVEAYYEMESESDCDFKIIPEQFISELLVFFAENLAVQEFHQLQDLVLRYRKKCSAYYQGLVHGYSILGQFRRAEGLAFYAHGKTAVPFSDFGIYSAQLSNYRRWYESRVMESRDQNYIYSMINYISNKLTHREFFVYHPPQSNGGSSFLVDALQELLKTATRAIRKIQVQNLRKTPRMKSFEEIVERQKAQHLNLDETSYIPILQSYLTYEDFQPLKVIQVIEEMTKSGITITAVSYKYLISAMVAFDTSLNQSFENSTRLLKRILEAYGVYKGPGEIGLDFRKDAVEISEVILHYALEADKNTAQVVLADFHSFCTQIFGSKLPLQLEIRLDKAYKHLCKNSDPEKYEKLVHESFTRYAMLLTESFQKNSNEGDEVKTVVSPPPPPPSLSAAAGDSTFDLVRYLVPLQRFDLPVQKSVAKALSSGAVLSRAGYNYVFRFLLHYRQLPLEDLLEIAEKYLLQGTLNQMALFRQKRICYQLCLIHLAEKYGDEEVEQSYRILSEFYDVESVESARNEIVKLENLHNFYRSESGRLFNIRLDDYDSRTMNQHQFINFFNPIELYTTAVKMSERRFRMLYSTWQKHPQSEELRQQFPKWDKYIRMTKLHGKFFDNISEFNRQIDLLNPPKRPFTELRPRRTKDVLLEILHHSNENRIFLTADATEETELLRRLKETKTGKGGARGEANTE
ncbi:uncharacterized protein LODBEIA_P07810 [Lodderomyces beijingensis]|uniref:Mitochondrial group I intron splicing factor CCM1 n=1 Tax=Lodderomyces beijingensis TaxID=1775926 RepID=A0ABP0ZK75_9ASCO